MFPHLSIDIKLFIFFTFKQHVFFREIRKHHTIVYKINVVKIIDVWKGI